MPKAYDVVIVGAGPAGLAAAIAILKKQPGISLAIVEAKTLEEERIGENCPPDLLMLLHHLGVEKQFKADGHSTCPGYASVWGGEQVGYNDFIVNALGPAWRLNRRRFDQMLAKSANELGAEFFWSTRFLQSESLPDRAQGYLLELFAQETKRSFSIQANFVIDASGHLARFAKSIGIEKEIEDQLFAIVKFSDVEQGQMSKQTLLEATAEGWWYTCILPDGRLLNMLVTDKEQVQYHQRQYHHAFEKGLKKTTFIGPTISNLSMVNPVYYTWPIYSGILKTLAAEDWMAIGDAASSYDPISAQGIYKALSDGISGAHLLQQFFAGSSYPWEKFSERLKKNYATYLVNRNHSYALESRWPDAPFWKNRKK